ncbi:CLUMA_CG008237, isoform A [Clunio marinus]|uniref:CLUMA_CG008237, isoform A n=1 Tax=Clunio marinus TaxID=568069 RepID=A0A1J1I8J0_9DIPT|nr:CLUMA_CG008237, isoform A [Clunio marinus]
MAVKRRMFAMKNLMKLQMNIFVNRFLAFNMNWKRFQNKRNALNVIRLCQSSLREVFRSYFLTSRFHRRHAIKFHRVLAEGKYDMENFQNTWNDGKRDIIDETIKKLDSSNKMNLMN